MQVKAALRSRAPHSVEAEQAYVKHRKFAKYKVDDVQVIVKIIEAHGYNYTKMCSATGKTEGAVSLVRVPFGVSNNCTVEDVHFPQI